MTQRPLSRIALALCAVFLVAGCESVNETMYSVRERISSIDLSMPQVRTADSGMKTDQTETIPPEGDPDFLAGIKRSHRASEMPAESGVVYTDAAPNSAAPVDPSCPKVTVVQDLGQYHQFENPAYPRPEEKVSAAVMKSVTSSCDRSSGNAAIEVGLTFEGVLGPRALLKQSIHPSFAYPYFIAVTAPDGTILSKEVFDVTLSYQPGQSSAVRQETVRQVIPAGGGKFAGPFEILVGFQLTEAELAYNRALLQSPQASIGAPIYAQTQTQAAPAEQPAKPKGPKVHRIRKAEKAPTPPATPQTKAPAPVESESAPETSGEAPAASATPAPAPAPAGNSPAVPAAESPAPVPAVPTAASPADGEAAFSSGGGETVPGDPPGDPEGAGSMMAPALPEAPAPAADQGTDGDGADGGALDITAP